MKNFELGKGLVALAVANLLSANVGANEVTKLTDELTSCNLNRALGNKCPEDYI